MYDLPLFPLNTVLFPGMPLPLRIFEPRYKEMINWCLDEKRPFGVVLIREGQAEHGPLAKPHAIGCTAQITQFEPLEDGQFAILSVGKQRFRIHKLKKHKTYLIGQVENLSLDQEPLTKLAPKSQKLYAHVLQYLNTLAQASGQAFDAQAQIPKEPLDLVYLAASVIHAPTDEKQTLLRLNSPSLLFDKLNMLFAHENALLRVMPAQDMGKFSMN